MSAFDSACEEANGLVGLPSPLLNAASQSMFTTTSTALITTITTITTIISALTTAFLPLPVVAARLLPAPPISPHSFHSPKDLFSIAAKELWSMDPAVARRTLVHLAEGYPKEMQTAAASAATTNNKGCWIAGIQPNKSEHCSVRPFFPRSTTRVANGAPRKERRAGQFVHRLAVAGWQPSAALELLLFGRTGSGKKMEASHLCHIGACFNPAHIIVEGHSEKERRKAHCSRFGRCRCGLSPTCIF